MIIVEDARHVQEAPQQACKLNDPSSQHFDATAHGLPPPPSYPKPPLPPPPHRSPQSPAGRFCKAFSLALLAYLLLVSITRTIVHMASNGTHRHWDDVPGAPQGGQDGRIVDAITHLNWTSYHSRPRWAPDFAESAETSFVLPLSAETLYLVSRGSYQGGKIVLKQATDRGNTDPNSGQVRVDLRVAYQDASALARATVCRLRKGGDRHGIGIYTPFLGWIDSRDRLWLEVVWTFPAAVSDRTPVHVRHFQTHVGNFAHEMGDLWRSPVFDDLEFHASNSPIHVESATLARGSLKTNNGAIVGHFNTSDALVLRSSNGHIQATVSLCSTARSQPELDMSTSNGRIDASVSLATSSDTGTGGPFRVMAHSSNGGVKLSYDDALPRSRLISDVATSNGAAEVSMHPTFEGTYSVSTTNARAVVRDRRPEDPEGRGRRRVVDQRGGRGGMVEGRVYWEGGRSRGEGRSTVRTSNAPASMEL